MNNKKTEICGGEALFVFKPGKKRVGEVLREAASWDFISSSDTRKGQSHPECKRNDCKIYHI